MKKILVAYDGSAPARRALETAAALAAAEEATVTVISVVPEALGLAVLTDPSDDAAVHRDQLADAVAFLEKRRIQAETLQPAGDPARAIESVARTGGFDTVVLGSRGRGAVSRALLGSVSSHVATHVKGTVVIVH
jgi:nucleotide-binding universal stress UspA family protein